MKKVVSIALCGALLVGCGMSNLGKGALIGTSAGAAVSAGIGRQMVKEAESGKLN